MESELSDFLTMFLKIRPFEPNFLNNNVSYKAVTEITIGLCLRFAY